MLFFINHYPKSVLLHCHGIHSMVKGSLKNCLITNFYVNRDTSFMSTHVPRFKNEVSLSLPPLPPKTWSEADGCDHWKVTGTCPVCQVEAAESLEVQVHSWLHSDLDSKLIWDCLNSNNKWQLKHSEVKDRRIATSSELSTLRPFLGWGGDNWTWTLS